MEEGANKKTKNYKLRTSHKMKKTILNIAALIGITTVGIAQNEVDALHYSQEYSFGTARSTAMGGAFGTLGADISDLSINPAGIALYKGSDVSFTPSFFYQQTTSSYNNDLGTDSKFTMNFNSVGFVFARPKETSSLIHGFSFGLAYNRTNNFTNAISIESKNNNSSILDIYVAEANGTNPSSMVANYPFDAGLAYDLYLLDTIPGDTTHYFSVVSNGGTVQRKYIETSGGMGQMDMTLGCMVGSRLYFGASLGFPTVKYTETSTYEESDEQDTIATLDKFTVSNHLTTTGGGFNIKFGAIYRIADFVRVGVAVHSPSVLKLTDSYYTEMERTFDSGSEPTLKESTLDYLPDGGIYSYTLTTPMRFTAGASFIIAKIGAISADYELVDYSTARLSASDYGFFDENNAVSLAYKSASNLKIGTEWKIRPLALRAGYAYYGSPYSNTDANNGSRSVYSVGVGFREQKYYLDFTYALSQTMDKYYMYDPAYADASASLLSTSHSFLMTLGFRF